MVRPGSPDAHDVCVVLQTGAEPGLGDRFADEGWQVLRRGTVDNIRARKIRGARGTHGYDPQLMSMRAIFIAAGPAFKRGATVAPFENVSIYNVVANILHLTPPLNDGDPAVVRALLREDTRVTVRSNRN